MGRGKEPLAVPSFPIIFYKNLQYLYRFWQAGQSHSAQVITWQVQPVRAKLTIISA